MPIGHDPRHALRIGEPAQVLLVGRHVDLEIGGEGEQVRGNAAREAEAVVHSQKSITGRPSTTVMRYSRFMPPITVARTQMSVRVPVTTRWVMPRARRAESSTVPLKPS